MKNIGAVLFAVALLALGTWVDSGFLKTIFLGFGGYIFGYLDGAKDNTLGEHLRKETKR